MGLGPRGPKLPTWMAARSTWSTALAPAPPSGDEKFAPPVQRHETCGKRGAKGREQSFLAQERRA